MGLFSWLPAQFSRSPMVEPGGIAGPPPLYYQHTRIGGSLTPDDVSNILRTADTGYHWRLKDLGNECRQKDGHLQAILATRELAVASLRPHVTPASEDAIDIKIADFTRDWLANFGTGTPKADEAPRD